MKINGLDINIVANHFVANDGCRQGLERSPIQLSDEEDKTDIIGEHNMLMTHGSGNPEPRIRNLLYFDNGSIGLFFMVHEELPIICPICKTKYVITKTDYELLKKSS